VHVDGKDVRIQVVSRIIDKNPQTDWLTDAGLNQPQGFSCRTVRRVPRNAGAGPVPRPCSIPPGWGSGHGGRVLWWTV
jgi:hypothetical protein